MKLNKSNGIILIGVGVIILISIIIIYMLLSRKSRSKKSCVKQGQSCKNTEACCDDLKCNSGLCSKHIIPVPINIPRSPKSKLALSYLNVVYPVVPNVTWKAMSDKLVNDLYTSLCWYYTPLPLDVGQQSVIFPVLNGKLNTSQKSTLISRRAPLVNAYYNASTEAYLTDGQDQVQIFSPVHESGAPDFKPDASCVGSQVGFTGVMPEDSQENFFLPVLESKKEVGEWWPQYVDPNPKNPVLQKDYKYKSAVCGFEDICIDGKKAGASYITGGTDKTSNTSLPSGTNYCFSGAPGAFASAFPSSPMGPIWNMGMRPCDPEDLDFTGKNIGSPAISSKCISKLYGLDDNDKLLGATSNKMLAIAKKANRTSAKFQMVNIIQPYGRKQGCPNFGFMEGVAYVMEGLGKKLLNAPDCSTGLSPNAIGALSRNVWCPPGVNGKKMKIVNRDTNKLTDVDMVSCNPSKDCKNVADDWKKKGGIIEYFQPYNPQKCSGCCYSSNTSIINNTNPNQIGTDNTILDKGQRDAYKLAINKEVCIQNNNIGSDCTGSKIMFYWMNGYGKFLNMGLTGVYSNYVGFLMSCPNQPWYATDPTKGPYLRKTIPQIVAMGLGGGAKKQLQIFTGERSFTDERKYMTGYVSTFQVGAKMGQKSGLLPSTYSSVLKKNIEYKYDFEATEDDYNNCIIIVSGRMLFSKTWGPHVLPNRKNASIWKNNNIDKSTFISQQKNDWYLRKFGKMGLPKDMNTPPGLGNCQGLLNPQEGIKEYINSGKTQGDTLLCQIATNTVQCYYPPNLQIENKNYNKYVKLTQQEGAVIWGAMYLLGDTGADWMGYRQGQASCAQVKNPQDCPSWPFGTYYFAANIGGCVYGTTAALGWNSSQFSIMSTGGGGAKACDYPNYDYEIVYVGGKGLKNQVCKNSVKLTKNGKTQYVDDVYGFKLLDISGNSDLSLLKYYIQENYVQGSTSGLTQDVNDLISCVGTDNGPVWASEKRVKAFEDLFSKFDQRYKDDYERYNQQPFSSCAMPLNEMNVHTDIWKNKRPNSLFYDEPKGKCNVVSGDTIEKREQSLSKYLKCEMNGDVATTWPFGIEKSGSSDCPYKDGNYGMRTEAVNNKVDQMWNYNIQGVNDKNDRKYHHGGRKYHHGGRKYHHGGRKYHHGRRKYDY